jgi:hypothetical protein
MKNLINNKGIKVISIVIILTGVTFATYYFHISAKYNNPDFKAYEKSRRASFCGVGFGGGVSESREQMYKEWQNHTPIGC